MTLSLSQECMLPMMVSYLNVRRVASYLNGGEEVLESAGNVRRIQAYKEKISKKSGTERECNWLFVTLEEVTFEDRLFLPGLDADNDELSKKPWSIESFDDPETGEEGHHWEIML